MALLAIHPTLLRRVCRPDIPTPPPPDIAEVLRLAPACRPPCAVRHLARKGQTQSSTAFSRDIRASACWYCSLRQASPVGLTKQLMPTPRGRRDTDIFLRHGRLRQTLSRHDPARGIVEFTFYSDWDCSPRKVTRHCMATYEVVSQ